MEPREGNRKRRSRSESNKGSFVYKLENFGGPSFAAADFSGPFVDNITRLLQCYAYRETHLDMNMPIWSLVFRAQDSSLISMFILQDIAKDPSHLHCVHCNIIGWSHELASVCKYHFIIPAENETCSKGSLQGVKLKEMESHLLHGVVHSNGLGHLINLSGREQRSFHATGTQLMALWDRICAMLRVRKISLRDDAKKSAMEWRLLHSLAYGMPWFGRWGFVFGRGSFGITRQMYSKAIETLKGMPFSVLQQRPEEAFSILSIYQKLSGGNLQTLGDLLSFMLELKSRLPTHQININNISIEKKNSSMPVRWPARRVEYATKVVIEALKKGNGKWISRLELRDSARIRIGDTGLLDFVLKSIGNCVVGCHIVLRATNPVTKILEYRLEDFKSVKQMNHMCRSKVMRDISYIYRHLMDCSNLLHGLRIILDTKNFVKDYTRDFIKLKRDGLSKAMDDMLTFTCRVYMDMVDKRFQGYADVSILLPTHATFHDLKVIAQKAFNTTYYATRNFHVESVINVHMEDEHLLLPIIESDTLIVLQGTGVDANEFVNCEKGKTKYIYGVDCPCGAKVDDGERLLSCSACNTLQHTRCVGILDSDEVPELFVCGDCSLEELKPI